MNDIDVNVLIDGLAEKIKQNDKQKKFLSVGLVVAVVAVLVMFAAFLSYSASRTNPPVADAVTDELLTEDAQPEHVEVNPEVAGKVHLMPGCGKRVAADLDEL